MKVEINIQKKYFFGILATFLILSGVIAVYAFGTNNPAYFGHSAGEIDWSGVVPQVCFSDGCVTTKASLVGPAGPQGPAGGSRLSWSDNIGRITIDAGAWGNVNNAAVSYADTAGSVVAHGCTLGASHWVLVATTGNNGHGECASGEVVTGEDRNSINTPTGFYLRCTTITC